MIQVDGLRKPVFKLHTAREEMSGNRNSLMQEVAALPWFHQIDFGDGIISPGKSPLAELKVKADLLFPPRLDGLTVLDIGCWDGFYSFEAHRRGASRVLATDYTVWHEPFWGDRRSFELARTHVAPEVEVLEIDVLDLTVEAVGTFDIVLFAGVLYHLKNPLAALERIKPLVRRTLIVETHMDATEIDRPAAIFYSDGYGGDGSNWWGPNRACVEGMLRRTGYSDIRFTNNPKLAMRGIFHAKS